MSKIRDKASFLFGIANHLRGPYKPNQYGKVMLPMAVIRRLDCVLAPTKAKVLAAAEKHKGKPEGVREKLLNRVVGPNAQFHNTSKMDLRSMAASPKDLAKDLTQYIKKFSPHARDIIDHFGFGEHIERLDKADRLFLVIRDFANVDLHPDTVSNEEMGQIFEELIRKYNEDANETAGDHFTPREVVRLIVNLLFAPDDDILRRRGTLRTLYDPTCGTGGMLAVAEDYLRELNPDAQLEIFGQDYNAESYAICGSDMLIKGHAIEHIVHGDTLLPHNPAKEGSLRGDGFPDEKFDYMLANPPFGVEWPAQSTAVKSEHENEGFEGRFGAGLPPINDGSFLFLQHMISKMKPVDEGGTRLGIVFNGSPLFTGDAGSGPSQIRRWIMENDWLEAIVALPNQLFYNTGIFTYVWILTNRKAPERAGRVQLIDGTAFYAKMRKSLGDKRNRIGDGEDGTPHHITQLTRIYGDYRHDDEQEVVSEGKPITRIVSNIFDTTDFAYRKVTIERPLRLRFEVTPAGLDTLRKITAFKNLAVSKKKDRRTREKEEAAGQEFQEQIIIMLEKLGQGSRQWDDRAEFLTDLDDAVDAAGLSVPKPIQTAIWKALGERDESAEICRDSSGEPEPDSELRDFEYVPYGEDVHAYFQREVLPHVPDAWIDKSKRDEQDGQIGIVGYEIPFNRHFYVYEPPRPLETIAGEIAELEKDIVRMLAEVTA